MCSSRSGELTGFVASWPSRERIARVRRHPSGRQPGVRFGGGNGDRRPAGTARGPSPQRQCRSAELSGGRGPPARADFILLDFFSTSPAEEFGNCSSVAQFPRDAWFSRYSSPARPGAVEQRGTLSGGGFHGCRLVPTRGRRSRSGREGGGRTHCRRAGGCGRSPGTRIT